MPAGFDTMTSLSIDVRARTHGRVDDLTTIYAQVFAADETTPLTNEVTVAANPGVTAWTTVTGISFAGVVPGTKSQWDGARLRIRFAHAAVGSADSTRCGSPRSVWAAPWNRKRRARRATRDTAPVGRHHRAPGDCTAEHRLDRIALGRRGHLAEPAAADGSLGTARVSDQSSEHDVKTLAVALVYARTGVATYRTNAANAIMSAVGTESGGRTLAVGGTSRPT